MCALGGQGSLIQNAAPAVAAEKAAGAVVGHGAIQQKHRARRAIPDAASVRSAITSHDDVIEDSLSEAGHAAAHTQISAAIAGDCGVGHQQQSAAVHSAAAQITSVATHLTADQDQRAGAFDAGAIQGEVRVYA